MHIRKCRTLHRTAHTRSGKQCLHKGSLSRPYITVQCKNTCLATLKLSQNTLGNLMHIGNPYNEFFSHTLSTILFFFFSFFAIDRPRCTGPAKTAFSAIGKVENSCINASIGLSSSALNFLTSVSCDTETVRGGLSKCT